VSFLLDTCVVSEFTRPRADPGVIEWLALHDESALFLSEVTLGELEKGLAKLPQGTRQKRLRAFVEVEVLERFADRVLPVDGRAWRRWGALTGAREREGRPVPVLDALLAATAWLHDISLVTRNERDFTGLGVRIVNPWRSTG